MPPGGCERGPLPPPAATAPPGDDAAESVVDPDVELPASSSRSRSPRVGLTAPSLSPSLLLRMPGLLGAELIWEFVSRRLPPFLSPPSPPPPAATTLATVVRSCCCC